MMAFISRTYEEGQRNVPAVLLGYNRQSSLFCALGERGFPGYYSHMSNKDMETGLIGGPEKRDIVIAEYDPEWLDRFAMHARRISEALGKSARRIEHIGSTSVPGLAAKPIIDILVEVTDSADESAYLPQLTAAGYVLRVREPDWNEHRMFRTPEKDVHVHVYSTGCPEIEQNIVFRDRLRSEPDERDRYEKLKRKLAAGDWADMNAYADAKTEMIESIIARADR